MRGWAWLHTGRQVMPVFSELKGLKDHISLQREEVEAQIHSGH